MKKKIGLDIGHARDTFIRSGGKGILKPEYFEEYWFNSGVGELIINEIKTIYNDVFDLVITQPLDKDEVKLTSRVDKLNNEKADLLVSIHADYNTNSAANGYWVFYRQGNLQGKKLAEIWDKYAKSILPNNSRGIVESQPAPHWTNFYITKVTTHIPGILIEHGFFSNDEDRVLLKSKDFQILCKDVIIKSICEYFGVEYREVKELGQEHFAEKHYKSLNDKGIVVSEKRFDDTMLRGEVMALLDRTTDEILERIRRENEKLIKDLIEQLTILNIRRSSSELS